MSRRGTRDPGKLPGCPRDAVESKGGGEGSWGFRQRIGDNGRVLNPIYLGVKPPKK